MKKLNPMHTAVRSLVDNFRAAQPVVQQLGPITFEVGNEGGAVFVRFTRPISNMALSTEQAKQFSKLLLQHSLKATAHQASVIEKTA